MLCGGGLSLLGAYDSVCDSVKPMTGNTSSIFSSTKSSLGVYALTKFAQTTTTIPVYVEGQVSQ